VLEGDRFTSLVQKVIQQTMNGLGAGGRFWQFGGVAVLDIPGTNLKGVDLPMVPKVYELHRTNLNMLTNSSLDWSMLCPGPMIEAPNREPTKGLRLSVDQWPVQPPPYASLLPKAALAFAFKQRVPKLTISYEDAADVILSNLDRNGPFSRKRVGVALPVEMRNFKSNAPGRGRLAGSEDPASDAASARAPTLRLRPAIGVFARGIENAIQVFLLWRALRRP
jgi:uncharacterized protein